MSKPTTPSPGNDAVAQYALGVRLVGEGNLDQAVAAFRAAVRIDPNRPEFYANLGAALIELGQLDEAATVFRVGIRLAIAATSPIAGMLYANLCNALFRSRRLDDAVAAGIEAVKLSPADPGSHLNLAISLRQIGDLAGATREYQAALAIDPTSRRTASALAYLALFDPGLDAAGVLAVCQDWSQRFEPPLLERQKPHANIPDPDRRLRVGYLSPNFHLHACAHFQLTLLEHHNHQQFEVHCFRTGFKRDAITDRHRQSADAWHDISAISDEQAAELIRESKIDILVDLNMHMADARLGIFCLKPSPIQATWCAYPGTTGLQSIDYRISDGIIDPPGIDEQSSERTVRLPNFWMCYNPLSQAAPRQPRSRDFISFGSFNTGIKLSESTLRLWARLLHRVLGSKLALIVSSSREAASLHRIFAGEGIAPNRIGMAPEGSRDQYLRLYDSLDIALDTLPYNGVTTTADALWMNVPVVTLVGSRAQGRSGASLLTVASFPELIARSENEFIEIAAGIANDPNRLAEYHRTLRTRLEQSPLMDGKTFAADMEHAYREMWRGWCAKIAPKV
jgi:predicted O-linked N-acetylglucosamine transferase (SPINDLY family)